MTYFILLDCFEGRGEVPARHRLHLLKNILFFLRKNMGHAQISLMFAVTEFVPTEFKMGKIRERDAQNN